MYSNVDNSSAIYFGLANAIRWKAPEKAPRSPNMSPENDLNLCASFWQFLLVRQVQQDSFQECAIGMQSKLLICL